MDSNTWVQRGDHLINPRNSGGQNTAHNLLTALGKSVPACRLGCLKVLICIEAHFLCAHIRFGMFKSPSMYMGTLFVCLSTISDF